MLNSPKVFATLLEPNSTPFGVIIPISRFSSFVIYIYAYNVSIYTGILKFSGVEG